MLHKETIDEDVRGSETAEFARVNQKSTTQTTLKYVPKEKNEDGTLENTDFEATIPQNKVVVKVNGKKQSFNLQQNETQKFEKGKLVLEQESTLNLDIKVPKRNELILYAQTEINNKGRLDNKIGVEKTNGKFKYGGTYSITTGDKTVYARYDIVKVYTN